MDEPEPRTSDTDEDEPLLKTSEVATMFRVNPKTVRGWVNAGKLSPFRTPGGQRRYRESEVRALLAEDQRHRTEGNEHR